MYRKCAHELRQAISSCRYNVRPYAADGDEPTKKAQEKAGLVSRAIAGMKPDRFTDEQGFNGGVYHLCDAVLNGISMLELQWSKVNGEKLPTAFSWVHPRHYTFTTGGRLTVYGQQQASTNLDFSRGVVGLGMDKEELERKFLVAQFLSASGSSLSAGLMRPLAEWWSFWVYGREWIAVMAQKHGTPFLHVSYKTGTSATEVSAMEARLGKAGANNYMVYPEGAVLNVVEAQSLGADNPIVFLINKADEQPQILLLGQTATTSATPGKLGGEHEHGKVKRENIEAGATWVSRVLSEQFAPSVLMANYGETDECPTVEADFTEDIDPEKQAARWSVLTGPNMPPVHKKTFYIENSLPEPKPGDEVIKNGQVTISEEAKFDRDLGKQVKHAEVQMALQSEAQGGGPQGGEPAQSVERDGSRLVVHGGLDPVHRALVRATDKELDELELLVTAAEQAEEKNGEAQSVDDWIVKLNERRWGHDLVTASKD